MVTSYLSDNRGEAFLDTYLSLQDRERVLVCISIYFRQPIFCGCGGVQDMQQSKASLVEQHGREKGKMANKVLNLEAEVKFLKKEKGNMAETHKARLHRCAECL